MSFKYYLKNYLIKQELVVRKCMNVTARVNIIMPQNEVPHLNVNSNSGVCEPEWRGAVWEGIHSEGKVKPVSSERPLHSAS